jgi:alpha-L-rhamnosidase
LLFNNCYLHYITTLVAKISAILGDATASTKYDADAVLLAAAVNKAFLTEKYNRTGVYVDMLQTHAVMPLMSPGLVPKAVAPKTWDNLAHQILTVNTGHLDTGLTGTYFLVKTLMESGRNDLIFAFANKTDFPSYGYFLELGYTTWPEQWDVTNGNSLMHGCYNAIGLWFIEGVAGIRVHASEYPPLTIRAGVDAGDIMWAKGHRTALHGRATSSWKLLPTDIPTGSLKAQRTFTHNVTVPVGGVAKVMVPCPVPNCEEGVTEGGKPVTGGEVVGVSVLGVEMVNKINYAVLKVVSGSYSFQSGWSRDTLQQPTDQCNKVAWDFCCEVGVKCDCSKGITVSAACCCHRLALSPPPSP